MNSEILRFSYKKTNVQQEWTGPPGYLALARWAGWSGVQVSHHVKCSSKSTEEGQRGRGEKGARDKVTK